MKDKLITYALLSLCGLFVVSQAVNTWKIHKLSSKVNDMYNVQVDSLTSKIKVLETSKDSLTGQLRITESRIKELETRSIRLKQKRQQNERYYNQKIDNVRNSTPDSLRSFLSNYKYTGGTSQRDNKGVNQ